MKVVNYYFANFRELCHIAGCPGGGERVQVQGDAPPHRLLRAGGGECRPSETGLHLSQYLKGRCHEIDYKKKFGENGNGHFSEASPNFVP